MADDAVAVDVEGLTRAEVIAVARRGQSVELTDVARSRMQAARAEVEELAASATPVYGISTGFGALATRHIPPELRTLLQVRVIRSHAAGMGEPVETEVVRAAMLLRLKTLARATRGAPRGRRDLVACSTPGSPRSSRVRLARLQR